jgi:hypothetical protein
MDVTLSDNDLAAGRTGRHFCGGRPIGRVDPRVSDWIYGTRWRGVLASISSSPFDAKREGL